VLVALALTWRCWSLIEAAIAFFIFFSNQIFVPGWCWGYVLMAAVSPTVWLFAASFLHRFLQSSDGVRGSGRAAWIFSFLVCPGQRRDLWQGTNPLLRAFGGAGLRGGFAIFVLVVLVGF